MADPPLGPGDGRSGIPDASGGEGSQRAPAGAYSSPPATTGASESGRAPAGVLGAPNARRTPGSRMSSEFQAALERKRNRLAAEGIAAGAAATGNRGYIQSKLKFGGRPPPSVAAPADGSEDDDFVQPRTKKHKVQPESGAPHSGGVPIARRTRSSPQSAVRRAPPRAPDDKKGRPVRKREMPNGAEHHCRVDKPLAAPKKAVQKNVEKTLTKGAGQLRGIGKPPPPPPAAKKTEKKIPKKTKANVRCCPKVVIATNTSLVKRQRDYVMNKGFQHILNMHLKAVEGRSLLGWILDHMDLHSMTLRAGRGKELKFTKEVVEIVLGLPSAGATPPRLHQTEKSELTAKFRNKLNLDSRVFNVIMMQERVKLGGDDELTMMCYFIVIFHSLLFPQGNSDITTNVVTIAHWAVSMDKIDWCQLIYTDLWHSVEKWQSRHRENTTATIYGCGIVLLL